MKERQILKKRQRKSSRKLLIVGIDVGLHTSLALLDLDGNVVCLDTINSPTNAEILRTILDFGDVVTVSTDRHKPPSRVKKIASSISANLVLPRKNMTKKKKRILIYDFFEDEPKLNSHEKSALASAIFAYKRFVPRFKKLKDRLMKENREEDFENLREKLVLGELRPSDLS
jgi:predicted RNase H-like nuclease (RuvC/YqgF family)